jgi:serine/threonine-protein kinase RsbW
MRREFCLCFDADELQARQHLEEALAWLKTEGLDCGKAEDVEIVLAEAINNIVEHAYTGLPGGKVCLRTFIGDHQLMICLMDSGHPMPNEQIPPAVLAPLPTETANLPEGGFGWYLIQSLTTAVRYQRKKDENNLYLLFDLAPEGDGQN